eukprot:11809_1
MGRVTLLSCITLCMVAKAADFKIGIRGAHKQNEDADGCVNLDDGIPRYSGLFSAGASTSDWATTTNGPDCWSVSIDGGSISVADLIKDKDIRFCIAVIHYDGDQTDDQTSDTVCTAWASEGGGWTDWVADDNCLDFDGIRVSIEEKALSGLRIYDAKVGIQLSECLSDPSYQKGDEAYSAWLSDGGGFSAWTGDSDTLNPNAVRMYGEFDAGCSIVGLTIAHLPHSCQCIPGSDVGVCSSHESHCNSVIPIAEKLDVDLPNNVCPDNFMCCCSCSNCKVKVSV